jgi:hypothetical protein
MSTNHLKQCVEGNNNSTVLISDNNMHVHDVKTPKLFDK